MGKDRPLALQGFIAGVSKGRKIVQQKGGHEKSNPMKQNRRSLRR